MLQVSQVARSGNEQKAEALADFFESVFTTEGPLPELKTFCKVKLGSCHIDAESIKKRLALINISKSPGPDQIHPRVLRELCDIIHTPLAIIISNSLDTGDLPTDWKNAHISAIFKKGQRKPENYRPISLTSRAVKIAESIIREEIIKHMKQHSLF